MPILDFENENNYAICEVKNGTLTINEEFVRTMSAYYQTKKAFEEKEKELKNALKKAMKENGIKSFKNDFVTITLKDAYVRDSVDVERMMKDGVYDDYVKEVEVAESIQLRWK